MAATVGFERNCAAAANAEARLAERDGLTRRAKTCRVTDWVALKTARYITKFLLCLSSAAKNWALNFNAQLSLLSGVPRKANTSN